ncbi:MAG: tetratricopeptide repeat protein, partial [Myxococcales bacterium]
GAPRRIPRLMVRSTMAPVSGLSALLITFALVGCKSAAPIHPLAEEHNTMCAKYLEGGELQKAQNRCELALEYNPDFPEPHNLLCAIEIQRGRMDKAKAFCIKALRLNNDFAEAHNNLGFIYLQENALGKAHDSFRAALRVNPGYLDARYNLGYTLVKLKKYNEARVIYDKLTEINPDLPLPWGDLCFLDIEEGFNQEAIQKCTRAVQLNPRFANAWFLLGVANGKAGQHCDAQEAYKECVAVESDHAECRTNIAIAARYCALAAPALQEIKQTAATGGDASAFYASGLAQKEKGLLAEADRDFRKCLKADGRFGLCHCQLAELRRQEAKTTDAKTFCKKCVNYTSAEQIVPEREMCERLLREE